MATTCWDSPHAKLLLCDNREQSTITQKVIIGIVKTLLELHLKL